MVKYRKRRARLQPDAESTGNFELAFDDTDKPVDPHSLGDLEEPSEDRRPGFDLEIGESGPSRDRDERPHDPFSLDASSDDDMQFDTPPGESEEMSLGESPGIGPPMEIQMGLPGDPDPELDEPTQGLFLAPIGRRFLAGLTDAMVLLLGAAVFGVIFWRVCGRLTLVPLNIAVLGFVAVVLIFSYFAVFTAIASATPGLLWMGMLAQVRNLYGHHPSVSESFWRAFGVLVSLSAPMLGFIWACVDIDGRTWHDRMSGTVITEEHTASDFAGLKVEI